MKKHVLLYIIMQFALITNAQPPISNDSKYFRLEVGYQNFRTLDLNTSPLIFVANNGFISFQYEKNNSTWLWNIGTSVSFGSNQSKCFGVREGLVLDPYLIDGSRDTTVYVINPALSFINHSLYYSYKRKLVTNPAMYIGASIRNNFYYGGIGADSWFFDQLSISPSFHINLLKTDLNNLIAEVSFPVLSFLVRQPYSRRPSLPENSSIKAHLQTGSNLATLNSFQQFNFHLGYNYTLANGNQLGLSYYFMWMRYTNIPARNLNAYSNTIVISYTL
jgi:hypothetical protein